MKKLPLAFCVLAFMGYSASSVAPALAGSVLNASSAQTVLLVSDDLSDTENAPAESGDENDHQDNDSSNHDAVQDEDTADD